jgi:hypothetical protein
MCAAMAATVAAPRARVSSAAGLEKATAERPPAPLLLAGYAVVVAIHLDARAVGHNA